MVLGTLKRMTQRVRRPAMDNGNWLPEPATHAPRQSDIDAVERASRRRMGEANADAAEPVPDSMHLWLGKRQARPVRRLIGVVALAVIGGAFLTGAYFIWRDVDGVPAGFCAGFGVIFTGCALYQLMATANPRLELRTDRHTAAPGEAFDLWWTFSKPPKRAARLTIRLVGEERATYRAGSSTSIARDTFHDRMLLELEHPPVPLSGRVTVQIPAHAAHSLSAPNNIIVWEIRATAFIRIWPDVRRNVDLRVWTGPLPTPGVEVFA